MRCPKCDVTLLASERQGVEVDHCPHCRGVWLDRGELDKIVDRYASYEDERFGGGHRGADYRHHPRQKSFWSELFD